MTRRRHKRLTYWQRRYVLRHYRSLGDRDLAQQVRAAPRDVKAFLTSVGATRSPSGGRRLQERQAGRRPEFVTPDDVRRRVVSAAVRTLGAPDRALIVLMFVASALLYAATAARTVTGEDAGELLAAAHGFGVPHPPGYPLWLSLAALADRLSFVGTVAWRVSMVSAVFAAGANAVLLAILLKTLRHRVAAVAGAALFAVSLTHWMQAVIPEVYGLNTFFVVLIAWLMLRLSEAPSGGRLVALAGVLGLACTNHTSAVPIAVFGAFAGALIAPRLLGRWTTATLVLLAGLIPLCLYFVLMWASTHDPYLDWGNPERFDELWSHVTRAQYRAVEQQQASSGSYGDYLRRLAVVAGDASRQFGSRWVLILAAVGLPVLALRQTGLTIFFLVSGWLCTVGVTKYTSFSFDREHVYAAHIFWIPGWIALAWCIAGGADVALEAVRRSRHGPRFLTGVLGAALLGMPVIVARDHHGVADRSAVETVATYGRRLLDVMDEGALYFPSSDHSTFAAMYWQAVEQYRTDVVLADKYGFIEEDVLDSCLDASDRLRLDRIPASARRPFNEALLIKKWGGPVYFANRREMSDLPGLVLEPVGPVFRVMTEGEADDWWSGDDPPGLRMWDELAELTDVPRSELVDFTVQMVHSESLYMKGFAFLRAGRLGDAIVTWERIEADLAPLKQLYNNMASALAEHGRFAEAQGFYERALREDPNYRLALSNLALVHRDAGELEVSARYLQRVLDEDPGNRRARIELARNLSRRSEFIASLLQYEQLALQDPGDALPWREGGLLLASIGDTRKAVDAYQRSLELDPRQPDVAQRLAALSQDVLREGVDSAGMAELKLSAGIEDEPGLKNSRVPWPMETMPAELRDFGFDEFAVPRLAPPR